MQVGNPLFYPSIPAPLLNRDLSTDIQPGIQTKLDRETEAEGSHVQAQPGQLSHQETPCLKIKNFKHSVQRPLVQSAVPPKKKKKIPKQKLLVRFPREDMDMRVV